MTNPNIVSETPIALVTGGSRGLGRSTVLSLAERGVASIFTYNSRRGEAERVEALAAARGVRAIALQLDIGDASSFGTFVQKFRDTLRTLGAERFDYLVNNAGISHHASIEDTTRAVLDMLYRVNFKGMFFLTQKLLPLLNDGGRIVNLSSGLSRIIVPGSAPYGAFKGALDVLTRYQAKEFGARRITVNAVAPGAIQTDFSGGMLRDNPELNKQMADMTALAAEFRQRFRLSEAGMQRRTFGREFELEAVRKGREHGMRMVQASRDPDALPKSARSLGSTSASREYDEFRVLDQSRLETGIEPGGRLHGGGIVAPPSRSRRGLGQRSTDEVFDPREADLEFASVVPDGPATQECTERGIFAH